MAFSLYLHIFRRSAVSLSVILLLGGGCERQSDAVLAEMEGAEVSVSRFSRAYTLFLGSTRLDDNLVHRRMVLDKVINEEIILMEASAAGLEEGSGFLELMEVNRGQILLNALAEKLFTGAADAGDSLLFSYYRRLNTYYDISQVFTAEQSEARDWERRLSEGGRLEDLPMAGAEDSAAVRRDLGYVRYEELVPEIRELLGELQVGERSGVFAGRYGYSIIRLNGVKEAPLLTLQEFAEKKEGLSRQYAAENRAAAMKDYSREQLERLDIRWDEGVLGELPGAAGGEGIYFPDPVENPVWASKILGRSGEQDIYYRDLYTEIRRTKSTHIQQIRDMKSLKDLLSGALLRRQLIREAEKEGLAEGEASRQALQASRRKGLIDTWLDMQDRRRLADSVKREAFYREAEELFMIPVRRRVLEFRSGQSPALMTLKSGAAEERPEGEELRVLAENLEDVVFTDLGWVFPGELGPFNDAVFSAGEKEMIGPFEEEGIYFLFRVEAELAPELMPADRRASYLESELAEEYRSRYLPEEMKELQIRYNVIKHEDRLKALPFFISTKEFE